MRTKTDRTFIFERVDDTIAELTVKLSVNDDHPVVEIEQDNDSVWIPIDEFKAFCEAVVKWFDDHG